jgi:hypothetical protein
MINPVLASWRRIPPQRGNTNGERVHSLDIPKLAQERITQQSGAVIGSPACP